jgi:transcriptional regulator with XRE-family HTH domain
MSATRKVERVTLALQMALDRQRAGAELAALRNEKRMTQDDLEEATGLSKRQLQRYEGGTSMPRWKNLDKLAEILGPEVYDIVRDDEIADVPAETPDPFGPTQRNGNALSDSELELLLRIEAMLRAALPVLAPDADLRSIEARAHSALAEWRRQSRRPA